MNERRRLLGDLDQGGELFGHKVVADEDLAVGRGEGGQVLGRVPRNVDDVRVLVPRKDSLVLGQPYQQLLVPARRSEEGAVRRPGHGSDIPGVLARECTLLLPVVLGHDLDIPRRRRHSKRTSVGMPCHPASGLGLGLHPPNDAVDLANQLRVLGREGVDIDDAIRAREGQHGAIGVERDVFRRLGVLLQCAQLGVVVGPNQLDGQLVAGHGAPLVVG